MKSTLSVLMVFAACFTSQLRAEENDVLILPRSYFVREGVNRATKENKTKDWSVTIRLGQQYQEILEWEIFSPHGSPIDEVSIEVVREAEGDVQSIAQYTFPIDRDNVIWPPLDLSNLTAGEYQLLFHVWQIGDSGNLKKLTIDPISSPVNWKLSLDAVPNEATVGQIMAQAGDTMELRQAAYDYISASEQYVIAQTSATSSEIESLESMLQEKIDELAQVDAEFDIKAGLERELIETVDRQRRCFSLLSDLCQRLGVLSSPDQQHWLENTIVRRSELEVFEDNDEESIARMISQKEIELQFENIRLQRDETRIAALENAIAESEQMIEDCFNSIQLLLKQVASEVQGVTVVATLTIDNGEGSYEISSQLDDGVARYQERIFWDRFDDLDGYRLERDLENKIADYRRNYRFLQNLITRNQESQSRKVWLEENIYFLANGGSELEEIDRLLATIFFLPADPELPQPIRLISSVLLSDLMDCGELSIADTISQLLNREPPRDLDELNSWRQELAQLLELKDQRFSSVYQQLQENARQLREIQACLLDYAANIRPPLRQQIRDCEAALRDARADATEEEQEQRRQAEEELQRLAEESNQIDEMRQLREAAQNGDPQAAEELATVLGIALFDDIEPGLGTGIANYLTLSSLPDCFCELLASLEQLVSGVDDDFRLVLADRFFRSVKDCLGIDGLPGGIEVGSDLLAERVNNLTGNERVALVGVLRRVRIMLECN